MHANGVLLMFLVTNWMSYKIPPKQNIILKYVSSIRRYNYRQTQTLFIV